MSLRACSSAASEDSFFGRPGNGLGGVGAAIGGVRGATGGVPAPLASGGVFASLEIIS